MITDERVRIFCVAAQVVDVEHKIEAAITECMRLGTHAIRTAMVPLPFSGMIGTPTVSRILCEHVLQCFGFPKALPEAVEDIMSRIVMQNLKQFMAVTLTQFTAVSTAAVGIAVATMGIGVLVGITGCFLSAPPTARMLLKCACDMILILDRSFRYGGKYVTVKQIEDAAKQYVSIRTTTFGGNDKRLQDNVHEQVDLLCPLAKVQVGFKFKKLRSGFEDIIRRNRFDRPEGINGGIVLPDKMAELDMSDSVRIELSGDAQRPAELPATRSFVAELADTSSEPLPVVPELPDSRAASMPTSPPTSRSYSRPSELSSMSSPTSTSMGSSSISELSASQTVKAGKLERGQSESSTKSSSFFKKGWKSSLGLKKTKSTT